MCSKCAGGVVQGGVWCSCTVGSNVTEMSVPS